MWFCSHSIEAVLWNLQTTVWAYWEEVAWGRPWSYDFSRQNLPYYLSTIAVSVLVSVPSRVFLLQYKTPTRSHTSRDQSVMHYDDVWCVSNLLCTNHLLSCKWETTFLDVNAGGLGYYIHKQLCCVSIVEFFTTCLQPLQAKLPHVWWSENAGLGCWYYVSGTLKVWGWPAAS